MVEPQGQPDTRPARSSKQDLLRRIQEGFGALMTAQENLDDRAMVDVNKPGDWSVKDNLAHIAAWEEILLRFHIGGEPFDSVVGLADARYRVTPYDEINDHLFRRDNGLTPGEARARLMSGHAAVMDAIARLTEVELHTPRAWLDAPDGPSGPLAQYIAWNTHEHYAEHLATIEALAKGA